MPTKKLYEVVISFKGQVVYKDTLRAKSQRTAAANVLVNRMNDDEMEMDKIEVFKREIKVHKREIN